jgi:glycosyltransferase involved in cell wall biosynthesis
MFKKELTALISQPSDLKNIGIGIVTYNSPEKILQSAFSVPENIETFVIVNDGTPYDPQIYPRHAHVITHPSNQSVGAAKNTALRYLLDQGVEHLFLMEDDVIIKNHGVFQAYIQLYQTSGIGHFCYALQGPSNLQLTWLDRVMRRLTLVLKRPIFKEKTAVPMPIAGVEYPNGIRIALYRHCPGAFCYFHRSVIERVGLNDENFINALEHLDHTYRIIIANNYSPFGWFPDLVRSDRFLANIPDCMVKSTIARLPSTSANQSEAHAHFFKKHGVTPDDLIRHAPNYWQEATKALEKLYIEAQETKMFQGKPQPLKFFKPFSSTW